MRQQSERILGSSALKVKKWCERWAEAYQLPPIRILAIGWVESNLNQWAFRYEPRFLDWLRTRIGTLPATELVGRATSWGPMQVLGQVAREEGFKGLYLTELCGEAGVEIGCKHFSRLLHRYLNNLDRATEAYNAGRTGTKQGAEYLKRIKAAEAKF